jgi:outer membrane lipoprotein-sorting protein
MQLLRADQKQQHISVSEELCQIASNDATFLSTVITGDESWIYGYDRDKTTIVPMENKEQSQEHAHNFL